MAAVIARQASARRFSSLAGSASRAMPSARPASGMAMVGTPQPSVPMSAVARSTPHICAMVLHTAAWAGCSGSR